MRDKKLKMKEEIFKTEQHKELHKELRREF